MILNKNNKGFTIIELIISVAIFGFMTAFLVAKYGNFNQGILLTNLAYDVALSIRNAQSYGINVRSKPLSYEENYSSEYNVPYGVHFDSRSTPVGNLNIPNINIVFFADLEEPPNKVYTNYGEDISVTKIKGGYYINSVCAGSGEGANPCVQSPVLDITFQRPSPNAIITQGSQPTTYSYAEIIVRSSSGLEKKVIVRSTGQIQVDSHF